MQSKAPPEGARGHIARHVSALWWVAKNSPWMAIAVLSHIIAIAVMGTIYIATGKQARPEIPPTIAVLRTDSLDAIVPPPDPPQRQFVEVVPFEDAKPGPVNLNEVGSSRVDLQACKLEYSIVSPK